MLQERKATERRLLIAFSITEQDHLCCQPARTATDIMASFEKTPPQTTASAVGLLRTLARDEQKKLAHLRATNGAADDIAAAETRVRDLTAKLCLLYTSPSPRDYAASRMPSSA